MKRPLVAIISIFLLSFFYLNQKVHLHMEAYRLTDNYRQYNELIDKRDVLLYNFSQRVSLPQVNLWAEHNDFMLAPEETVFAFNAERPAADTQGRTSGEGSLMARLNNRIFNIPGETEALAEDKE